MERLRNDFSTAGQLIPEVHTIWEVRIILNGVSTQKGRQFIGTQDMLLSRA